MSSVVKESPDLEGFPIAGYFCISLPHRTDRYRAFITQMADSRARWIAPLRENIRPGVWYEAFAQIPWPIPPLAPYLQKRSEGTQLGTIGCYHAHVHVLEEIASQQTNRWYVVFEDDVRVLSLEWLTVLSSLRLPAGFEHLGLVLVDPHGQPLPEDRLQHGWYRPSRTHPAYVGTHCYVVLGSQAARNVLAALGGLPYLADIDSLFVRCGQSLAWYPGIVDTGDQGSDRLR